MYRVINFRRPDGHEPSLARVCFDAFPIFIGDVTAAQRARIAVAPEHLRGRHAVPETAWSFAWRTTPNSNALLVRHFAMTPTI